jgi:hypothetical protein
MKYLTIALSLAARRQPRARPPWRRMRRQRPGNVHQGRHLVDGAKSPGASMQEGDRCRFMQDWT